MALHLEQSVYRRSDTSLRVFCTLATLSLHCVHAGVTERTARASETANTSQYQEVGSPAPNGQEGLKYCDGVPGRDGLAGRDGLPGLNGRDGLAGLPGRDGSKGEHGDRGNDGQPGSQGLQGQQGPPSPGSGGNTYIRWGRTVCPSVSGTSMVYSGWAAGSHFSHGGSGANYICLTTTPQYLNFSSATDSPGLVYGAEYEAVTNQPNFGVNDQEVPCAVCHATQRSVLMIPGQYTCPTGWTREYNGYLVTTYFGYPRTTYECMDADPEAIPGGSSNQDGALFYHVEARCGSLSCPPYDNTKELTCAVCSK